MSFYYYMATKTQTKPVKQQQEQSIVSETERPSDNDILTKAYKQGWRFNNHPLPSRRFFEHPQSGKVARSINDLRSQIIF